ncbi:MAG: adenosylcobinamide-GDP ribazoletransferase [Planctomycetes bacterium]|nr:adenosylcobinamide-GDP ribazoletransferase [Planctomycetota bacterium]
MIEQFTLPEDTTNLPEQPGERTGEWAAFGTAVQFLTRLPWPSSGPASPAMLSRCPVYFPVVGGMIGVMTSIVLVIGCLVWPVWLAVIVALAFEARLTGAFHEDAVADFCDAFGGGWTRDDVLRILKDSRIGSYGALGLGIAVALRAGATLETVQQAGRQNWLVWSSAVIASSAISRFVVVVAMVWMPADPSRQSLSRDIGRHLTLRDLFTCALWMLPVVLPFVIQWPLQAAVCGVALVPTVWWFMSLVRRRLGGITGDCLGCLCYLSMVLVLLATAARWNP